MYLHPIQITALEDRVGVETEATAFTDQFWQSQQIIINALDNIQVNKMKEGEISLQPRMSRLKGEGV